MVDNLVWVKYYDVLVRIHKTVIFVYKLVLIILSLIIPNYNHNLDVVEDDSTRLYDRWQFDMGGHHVQF